MQPPQHCLCRVVGEETRAVERSPDDFVSDSIVFMRHRGVRRPRRRDDRAPRDRSWVQSHPIVERPPGPADEARGEDVPLKSHVVSACLDRFIERRRLGQREGQGFGDCFPDHGVTVPQDRLALFGRLQGELPSKRRGLSQSAAGRSVDCVRNQPTHIASVPRIGRPVEPTIDDDLRHRRRCYPRAAAHAILTFAECRLCGAVRRPSNHNPFASRAALIGH